MNNFLMNALITAVVVLLLIIFGNTGSGFFNNLLIFIFGTILGTPLAMLGQFLMSLYNDSFKYIGLVVGGLLGGALVNNFISDKAETTFMGECVQNSAYKKSECQCAYDKLSDDKLNATFDFEKFHSNKAYANEKIDFVNKTFAECKGQ